MANGRVHSLRSKGRLRRDVIAGHAEGAAFGGMVGLGESYLPAFVLAVGLGEITAGLVGSLPLLAGGLIQTLSPLAIRWLGSHKRWVLFCALVQAMSFVPLVLAATAGRISSIAVLVLATAYWGSGLATGPAWNTWMGVLIPRALRAHFFANRTRMSQLAVLAGFALGGCILHWSASRGMIPLAFAGLFLGAAVCRLISLGMLALQREPASLQTHVHALPGGGVWRQIRGAGGGPLVLYLVIVQGAVQISGPFFTPFMFKWLHLSYLEYMALIAVAYMAKIALLPAWGNVAHRLGALRLLWLGGIGIVPISAMWIVSDHFAWLLSIQVLSGAVWGAYELGFFLMFFDSIPEDERTGVLTFYNLANTTAWVLGSAMGGLLLYSLGTGRAGYLLLFGISSVGRALALFLLRRVTTCDAAPARIALPAVDAPPLAAVIDAPLLPSPSGQATDPLSNPIPEPAGDLATAS